MVALRLPANNLGGALDGLLDGLRWLRVLDVSGNSLKGPLPLPAGTVGLLSLSVQGNAFEYSDELTALPAQVVALCRSGTRCDGLPPKSCAAFGEQFELKLSDPNSCIAYAWAVERGVSRGRGRVIAASRAALAPRRRRRTPS